MTNGSETPGIGGVPGLAKLSTKAPRAWKNLMHTVTGRVPSSLSKTSRSLARLRRM